MIMIRADMHGYLSDPAVPNGSGRASKQRTCMYACAAARRECVPVPEARARCIKVGCPHHP